MASQKQFILRYQDDGHVRFQIPEQFCRPDAAEALTASLLKTDGVYRVTVYCGAGKLSIRYQETVCTFKVLAKRLFDLVAELEQQQQPQTLSRQPGNGLVAHLKAKAMGVLPTQWFKKKLSEAKETVAAAKILVEGIKKNKAIIDNPQRFVNDFFNDILALYLIKLHWEAIIKQWIPNPWKHRYEWLAVSYLLYLLMRSRNPKH